MMSLTSMFTTLESKEAHNHEQVSSLLKCLDETHVIVQAEIFVEQLGKNPKGDNYPEH